MEHYVTVVCDLERDHFPQSSSEVIERATSLDDMLYNYFKSISKAYERIRKEYNKKDATKSMSKEEYIKTLSDIEGWIKEVAIIYGKFKFLADYTKNYSYEKLRRTSNIVLNLELFLNKSIEYLINESHKTNPSERKYYEFALGIGYDIKNAIEEADVL